MNFDQTATPKQNNQSIDKEVKGMIRNQTSKIISLNPQVEIESHEKILTEILSSPINTALTRIEDFFNELFNNQEIIPLQAQPFKQWQIKLSKVIRDGQNRFEFINTIAPMELAETLLVGYCGMFSRCQLIGRNDFFDTWLKTNRRILLT